MGRITGIGDWGRGREKNERGPESRIQAGQINTLSRQSSLWRILQSLLHYDPRVTRRLSGRVSKNSTKS